MIASIFIDQGRRLRSGWRFIVAFIVVFGSFVVGEYVARGFTTSLAIRNMINRPVSTAIMLVVFLLMARFVDHSSDPPEHIGLGTQRPWMRDLLVGTACGVLLVSACVGFIAIVGAYSVGAGPMLNVNRWLAVAVVAWIFIFGAITEELGFRSYAFTRLIECFTSVAGMIPSAVSRKYSSQIGSWLAILFFSGLFGAVHLGNPNATFWGFANTVLIGIFFGLLMVRTGSLWLLWGVHFGWNFSLGALYGLPVSGIGQFSVLWTGHASGPKWLTGGDYGIEASATAAAVVLIGIVAIVSAKRPGGARMAEPHLSKVAGS
jgi:uncharacterized protein